MINPRIYRPFRISIHEPFTGLDKWRHTAISARNDFNPRALHRARLSFIFPFLLFFNISIHEPFTGLDDRVFEDIPTDAISIHEPFTGLDVTVAAGYGYINGFQSTSPSQGSTRTMVFRPVDGYQISIHEPFTGLDSSREKGVASGKDFNPRALHRARP